MPPRRPFITASASVALADEPATEQVILREAVAGAQSIDDAGERAKKLAAMPWPTSSDTVKQEYITVATTGEPLHSFEPFYRLDTWRQDDGAFSAH